MGETRRLVSPARVFARPTADQIWLGAAQQAALSQLSRPARARLLSGPPSSGKTSLLNYLAATLATDAVVLHCRGAKESATALLAGLLMSADLPSWELSEVDQRNLLTVFLQERRSRGRRVVLVVDDVHTLSPGAWEEVERLLAFKIDRQPALELLAAGPGAWFDTLDLDRLGMDRSSVDRHELTYPTPAELISYLEWRLARFDLGNLMTPVAVQMVARLSGGRFAGVDVLCQMALLLLRQLRLERVDARVVRQAIATLVTRRGAKLEPEQDANSPRRLIAPPHGYLLISRGGKLIGRATLGQRTLLGRSQHNDVCLESPYLSRHHAVIVGTPEGYYIVDLNSVNGLTLNGKLVERAVLCDQDVLAIGPFRLKIQIPHWLAHGNPFPEAESLADTAVMPPHLPGTPSNMRRVK